MSPQAAAMRLFLLASGGLIIFEPSSVPRYRYTTTDPATDLLLRELVDVYATNRVVILNAIEEPVDPISTFADAFKLKK